MPNVQYCRAKGRPRLTKTEDNRLRVTRFFEVRAESIEPAVLDSRVFDAWLTPDSKYTNCLLVDQYTSPAADQTVEVTLTQVFEELGSSPVRVGSIQARAADGRAFVGTDSSGAIISSTRFAREWTTNYVVTGDVASSDGSWLAVSATLSFGSRTGYLTGTSAIARANGYSLIARTYNELPGKLVYDIRDRYTFPGKLVGTDGDDVSVEPGSTRETSIEVEETYHIGEVAAQAVEFEVLRWASGTISGTASSGGGTVSKQFFLSGVLGDVSFSGSNIYLKGVLCDSVAGVIDSDPGYPTGKKRISSKPSPWRGDIWKRTNLYVTFP